MFNNTYIRHKQNYHQYNSCISGILITIQEKFVIFRDATRIGIGTDTTATFGGSSGEYGIGIRCGQYSPQQLIREKLGTKSLYTHTTLDTS